MSVVIQLLEMSLRFLSLKIKSGHEKAGSEYRSAVVCMAELLYSANCRISNVASGTWNSEDLGVLFFGDSYWVCAVYNW